MGYSVPTMGIQGFNEGNDTNYRAASAGVCAGSAAFTVFLAFEIEALGGSYASVGNIDTVGLSGWIQERLADTGGGASLNFGWRINTTGGIVALGLPEFPGTFLMGRTVLFALTVDDEAEEIEGFVNGMSVGTEAYGTPGDTYIPASGPARFGFGNASQVANPGTSDRLIAFGYVDSAVSAENMVSIWQNFRQTSNLRLAGQEVLGGFGYSYEALDISAPPKIAAPTTFPNGGTVAGGDLTWAGAVEDVLAFTVDRDTDFGLSLVPAV